MTDQESVGRSLLEEILGKISSLLKRSCLMVSVFVNNLRSFMEEGELKVFK